MAQYFHAGFEQNKISRVSRCFVNKRGIKIFYSIFKKATISSLLVFSACHSTNTYKLDKALLENRDETSYQFLVERLKVTPTLTDVVALRALALGKSPSESSEFVLDQLITSINSDCLALVEQRLNNSYLDLNAHYLAMACHFELGDSRSSRYHQSILNFILQAIWLTGDGKTPATALQVINMSELRAFVEFHSLVLISQERLSVENKNIYRIKLQDTDTQEEFYWYFNLSDQALSVP